MHRSYQPLKPVTNRYLQHRWDLNQYELHRRKVSSTLPVVDNKGMRTPAHIQLKPKKLPDQRRSIIDRDNRLLASKLAHIVCSEGLVDHRNQYSLRSLNGDKRREELLQVGLQNLAIYRRITCRQSEYRRQLWSDEWERTERRRDDISQHPRGLAGKQRKVKFAATPTEKLGTQRNSSKCPQCS
ncbi:sperm axonemal maintenance protein CFAP97D1 [Pungitius pungitius]|uniref:sperm axonemal maintenance protein CFAP97D1 n=1 Tax=Pungitius pungitius TaxID=134920 RepID=UPI0018898FE6|nr:sperm axonemal maintenance protein CFAP97D1 [Pungitius pungitius]